MIIIASMLIANFISIALLFASQEDLLGNIAASSFSKGTTTHNLDKPPIRDNYILSQLKVKELASTSESLSKQEESEFFSWIGSMSSEKDDEIGISDDPNILSFTKWLLYHKTIPTDKIFVFFDKKDNKIVATASLVKQDRGVEAEEGGWVLGGVNVHREYRGRKLFWAIMQFIENFVQNKANDRHKPISVKLFTSSRAAIHVYETLGFEPIKVAELIQSYSDDDKEIQYKKIFFPKS